MGIAILKGYLIFTIILMIVYAIRHLLFAYNRTFGRQKLYYNDIYSSRMPKISVLIPMHNEEQVLHYVLDSLLKCDYDRDRLEIIPINDNSTDRTKELLEEYHAKYELIRPLHRDCPNRGKPAGLNDAMAIATGEIIIVFDADYRPATDMLKQLAIAFADPSVGAVMGRVIPFNANHNLLTRLINLERSGGYQVDQQARYNMGLLPQYGGTVGGFRKDVLLEMGGFNPAVLAEDTELTFRLYTHGWKVIYANSAECYEETPETWEVRGRQIRRWSRGHNNVMFRYLLPVLISKRMNWKEKLDGILLLLVYAVPFLLALGQLDAIALFFMHEMNILSGWWVLLFIGAYCSFGNFAPFYEIGSALTMDGIKSEIYLLPLIMYNFYFYMWTISLGFLDSIADLLTGRQVVWAKTVRFVKQEDSEPQEEQTVQAGEGVTR
jgi:cellulose synthase/poly-beta-1,6-N-acetylglucosamine synthase-like glycosyltransferase